MSIKGWMLGKVNRVLTRSDLPLRRSPRPIDASSVAAAQEPTLNGHGDGRGTIAASLEHLGAYGALMSAIRDELGQFVTTDLRLHLAIAEHDRYLLTSIHVDDTGDEDAHKLLQRFSREFAPEQVKHYLSREIIARLPNASAIDLSQFAGLNAGRKPPRKSDESDVYEALMKELRSAEPMTAKRQYQVKLIGRWSEADPRLRNLDPSSRRSGNKVTPLARRSMAIDVDDAHGSRRVELNAVIPGRRYAVGKDPACDVVVNGVYASRRHCEFWLEKGSWWITDSGSTNGIRVEPSKSSALEGRPVQTSTAADGTVVEVDAGACIVLSASARGDAGQYPRLLLRPLGDVASATAGVADVRPTPVTPIAVPRRTGQRLALTLNTVSGVKTVDLPQDAGPFRVGRSRTQGLVIDWAHEGVSGHHLDIIEPDEEGARVRVHGDNGVTIGGATYRPGSEFRWQVGQTMVFGRAGQQEPECSLTLSRRS